MNFFYQEARQKQISTSQALKNAKNRLRSIPRWKDPYYWAGFVVQGDQSVAIGPL